MRQVRTIWPMLSQEKERDYENSQRSTRFNGSAPMLGTVHQTLTGFDVCFRYGWCHRSRGCPSQLYVGSSASESSLTAVPGATPFLGTTPPFAGFFNAGVKTLPGFPAGSRPFFQVRAWEAAGGTSYDAALAAGKKVGKSAVFELADRWGLTDPSGMPPGPPPLLLGLTSFSLVPEPPAIALGIAGAVAVFLFATRRRCA